MKNQPDNSKQEEDVVIHSVSTAPTHDEDDEEAIREAARHRQHAQNLVRDHLEHHVDQNPGASSDYVTWIATLHPENADIAIDQRFFVPGNPWWTIYEDTKNNNTQIPLATAVPINGTQQTSSQQDDIEGGGGEESKDSSQKSDATSTTTTTRPSNNKSPNFCMTCNPIAIFCGLAFSVAALVIVLTLELVALVVCYLPATLFYHCGQAFAPPNCCSCLLYVVFMVVYSALSFADSMLLLASVLVTECLCLIAYFVGMVTGGCLWAKYLQQQIRKFCHGIRIVFRKSSSNSNSDSPNSNSNSTNNPPRGLCFGRMAEERKRNAKAHLNGVRVVTVKRKKRSCESCH